MARLRYTQTGSNIGGSQLKKKIDKRSSDTFLYWPLELNGISMNLSFMEFSGTECHCVTDV